SRSLVADGYQPQAASQWTGAGITSSVAANDSSKAVGFADAGVLLGAQGGTFLGVDVDGTAVIVTYTLLGDANLDRKVNFGDLVAVAQSYEKPPTDWSHGD